MVQPLTDTEKQMSCDLDIKPHPDGKPWIKCCGTKSTSDASGDPRHCQCLMRRARGYPSRMDSHKGYWGSDQIIAEGGRFFCVHRTTDDGFHRECAGWAAKFTKHNHGERR